MDGNPVKGCADAYWPPTGLVNIGWGGDARDIELPTC